MDLIQVFTEFATEEACLEYLEKARWPEGVRCIGVDKVTGEVCDSDQITGIHTRQGRRTNGRRIPARHLYQCRTCGRQFTAKTDTLFNDSHLPLRTWFLAIALIKNARSGLSAKQLQRDLKVSYQTAWYLSHRIRECLIENSATLAGDAKLTAGLAGLGASLGTETAGRGPGS